MPTLNEPQARFLALEHPYRALVAGYGCLRGDTLVMTERGPMPISCIDRPMRVLSWSAKNGRFELCLSGGAFPKGVGNLYQVSTKRGEFVSSGHHRILCADGSYRCVENLAVGQMVFASSQIPLLTNLGEIPKSSHGGDPRCLRKLASSMGSYANAARRYGQQLLREAGIDPQPLLPTVDVRKSARLDVDSDDLGETGQGRIRQGLQIGPSIRGLGHRIARRAEVALRLLLEARFEHASRSIQGFPRSGPKSESHPTTKQSGRAGRFSWRAFSAVSAQARSAEYSDKRGSCRIRLAELLAQLLHPGWKDDKQEHQVQSFCCTSSEACEIISIERLSEQEAYWDLQVLDTNNYVTADGLVHHNSGKTWAICSADCMHYWKHPRADRGYFAPTYPQIRDIYFPTIEEVAHDWGLRVKIAEANKEVAFYSGRQYRGTTICRSMEKPASIVGFKIARASVDEIDTMPEVKATQAWRKIIARLRLKYAGANGADVATTPEGFRFTWRQFVKAVRDKPELATLYGLVHASTYENEAFLPDDYIANLRASYPPQLIEAYLDGQFVNLTSGTIYRAFDRKLNGSQEAMQDGEAVYVGMDFNVGKMASIIHVKRDGMPHAVGEVIDAFDTPDMIRVLRERLWRYEGGDWKQTRQVRVYPDSSGGGRRSVNASTTDLQQLRAAGFTVIAPPANPPVKDRINAMNAMFCNAERERRYRVNADLCPTYADHLEQQVWGDNGEPDKSSGADHTNDAAGYFIHKEYPIVKPVASINLGFAN